MPGNGTGFLKKVKSESVVQQIIDSLTDAMIRKQLRPGDKIPTETELAAELGVGRNSVREAVKILVYLGVLEIKRAEGTFVCRGFSESMIDPMVYGVILNSADSAEDLMTLREIMETGAVKVAAARASDKTKVILKERLDAYKAEIDKGPGNLEAVFVADSAFHDAIAAMGGNSMVEKLSQVVRVLTHSIRLKSIESMLKSGRSSELYKVHERLFRAIEEKDLIAADMAATACCRLGRS